MIADRADGSQRRATISMPGLQKDRMIPLRQCAGIAMLGCLLALAPADTRAAVTEDQFVARTAGDLAALCSADPSDRLYTAAVNFCHGFGAGTYGVLSEVENANPKVRLFCAPQVLNPRATRLLPPSCPGPMRSPRAR